MIKLAIGLYSAFVACEACTPASTPDAGTVDAAPPSQTAVVCQELIEGGCLMPSDAEDVCLAVYEQFLSDVSPTWLTCLYANNGTVKTCAVPCNGGE